MEREIKWYAVVKVYDEPEDLPNDDQILLQTAKNNLSNAYAPYSGFQVSASILLENGEILVGTNHENAAYPMCLCAERVVLAAAHAQFPGIPIKTIAITVQNQSNPVNQPAAPCGACRQVICETEYRYQQPIQIILQGEIGEIYKFQSGKDLLPLAFDGNFL